MPDVLSRLRASHWSGLAFLVYAATLLLWLTLSDSATLSTLACCLSDPSGYYGSGVIAGAFLVLPIAYGWYWFRISPRLDPAMHVTRIRDRPMAGFMLGLAAGTVGWSLGLVAVLAVGGARLPWPALYGIGFLAGATVVLSVIYAIFLALPYGTGPRRREWRTP